MAGRGNTIIVSANPQGKFMEGRISGTPKPGTAMQIKTSSGMGDDGRFTYEAYTPGTDGEQRETIILLEDWGLGKLMTEAYVDSDRGFLYSPVMGEELNVLKGDVAGTADDLAFGDMLMRDTGTGKYIKTTGSPESEDFQCLETITDPVADVLVHAKYTGS